MKDETCRNCEQSLIGMPTNDIWCGIEECRPEEIETCPKGKLDDVDAEGE